MLCLIRKKDDHFVGRPLIILLCGQDLWTFSRDGDRMLGDHRLDREHHAFLDADTFSGLRLRDTEVNQLLGRRRDLPDSIAPVRIAEPVVELRVSG
jgi:hypothetical protein